MSDVYLPRNPAEQASQDYLSRIQYANINDILFQGRVNTLKIMEMKAYHDHTEMRVKSMLPKINIINGDYNGFITPIVTRLIDISLHNNEYISDVDIRNMIKEKLNQHTDSLFHRLFKHVKSRHPELLYERLITEIMTRSHSPEIENYIDYLNSSTDGRLREVLSRLLELPIFDQYTFELEEVWNVVNSDSSVVLCLRELLFKFIKMGMRDISYSKIYEEFYHVARGYVNETLDRLNKNHSLALESVEYRLFSFLSDKIRNYTLSNYKYIGKEGITYVKMLKYLLGNGEVPELNVRMIEDVKTILAADEYKYHPKDMEELYHFFEIFPDRFKTFSDDFLKYILDKPTL